MRRRKKGPDADDEGEDEVEEGGGGDQRTSRVDASRKPRSTMRADWEASPDALLVVVVPGPRRKSAALVDSVVDMPLVMEMAVRKRRTWAEGGEGVSSV